MESRDSQKRVDFGSEKGSVVVRDRAKVDSAALLEQLHRAAQRVNPARLKRYLNTGKRDDGEETDTGVNSGPDCIHRGND